MSYSIENVNNNGFSYKGWDVEIVVNSDFCECCGTTNKLTCDAHKYVNKELISLYDMEFKYVFRLIDEAELKMSVNK